MNCPDLEQRKQQQVRPNESPVMYQTWRDLLFLHWKIEPETIQPLLPEGIYVDTFDGNTYLGLVPFFMDKIRPRWSPPLPWISWFLEFNVRTYVHDENGTPGVWFFSLDCNQPIAVWAARTFFRLPYFRARMSAQQTPIRIAGDARPRTTFHSQRRSGTQPASEFIYSPLSKPRVSEPGTLEFFLVERYILFAETAKGLASGQVHHAPYKICEAEVEAFDANVLILNGIDIPADAPVSALYSPGVDVDVFALKSLAPNA